MRASALALAVLLASVTIAGCIDNEPLAPASTSVGGFDTTRAWSMPRSPAVFEMLEPVLEMVPSFDGTSIAVGLFMPEIAGCDWSAAELPAECKIPVVMDAGPYFGADPSTVTYRPPLIEWLVPRGYAVAHMSVRGTGLSGGCMELFSMNEQKDVDHIVTWLGERPWSSGNVGMMGRSYDGTTPFMAAAFGNPYLKTIVPISGVPSLSDLMFKNGTSELRGSIFHSVVYWGNYGVGAGDGSPTGHRFSHLQEQACEDAAMGAVKGPLATLTGDTSDSYWQERELRERTLANYEGSIWIIHGLEDWNVNPSQVIPFFNDLQDKGLDAKLWLGVWGHAYPDRVDEHRNVRWDWAEHVVTWFDKQLKGANVDTGPAVEVEDSLFVWRAEESYPPRDIEWREFMLDLGKLTEANANGGSAQLGATGRLTFTSDPLETNVRIAGLPQLHVTVAPTTARGGYLFAELLDVFPDGQSMRIGWAAIDLPHYDGGNKAPKMLVPGQPIVAKMEFEPMDAHIGEGHRLRLVLHKDGVEDIIQSPSPETLMITLGSASVLRLSTVERPSVLPTYVAPGLS